MKKTTLIMLIFVVAIFTMGCGSKKVTETPKDNTPIENSNEATPEGNTDKGKPEGTSADTKVEAADEAADKIAELPDVESATVLVTDENAYVAVVMSDKAVTETTTELENQVTEKVKSTDASVENVYVSVNPDFVERLQGYREKVDSGEPIEGFFEEFSEAMERVFPTTNK